MKRPVILNAAGEPIVLNAQEQNLCAINQKQLNALGYEVDTTTLTTIMKKVTDQKFFEIAPAEYLPVRVGEGAWSSNLLTYQSVSLANEFAQGVINTGGNNGRLAAADSGVTSVTIQVINWAKSIGWSLFDLQLASKSGNWDLVTSKERARKTNWDLGIQEVAFLGLPGNSACLGLLNLVGVTDNASVITKPISSMTPTELKAFQKNIIESFRANCQRTAWPTHFIIPESDYNGLASQSSEDFPIKSVLALLEEAFQLITRNAGFKILPLAYGDATYNAAAGIDLQRYVMLRYDDESIRMDIPVDYTNTLANSIDNFSYQNVGYGQFTGVGLYRSREVMYFSYDPTP